jgi:threonine dehydrogenase-like Zn-dependent dehydrogenase
MKASAVYAVEKDTVQLQEFEIDEGALGPEQVLTETHYSIISPGTELDCVSGVESSWFHFPQQLGYCAVGEVLAAGAAVTGFSTGDIVLTPTPHASHSVADADMVRAAVPAGIDPKSAVWTHIALISMVALRASSAELGDYAAVVGQGLIGNFAAQLFKAQGCRVIAIDRVRERIETAGKCGIEHLIDASAEDVVAAVRKLTQDRGAEVVVEATGSAAAALQAADMAAQNGEVILLGTPRRSHEADVTPLLRAVHRASPNITLKGAHGSSLPSARDPFVKHSNERNAEIILDMIQRGELALEPLLSGVAKPKDAPNVYRELRDHPETALGYILDWTS